MNEALSIAGLCVDVPHLKRRIVDDVSLRTRRGEISALVGESGSGKSTVALGVLGYAKAGATLSSGTVTVDGVDVLALSGRSLLGFRRERVSYVPQDPGTALNPAVRIGAQFSRVIGKRGLSKSEQRVLISEALGSVALPTDERFLRRYPQELSGGQQQRALIAMAIINRPAVIIWDEPTTGLDVVTKQEILRLIRDLSHSFEIAGLYISHDLSAVAEIADTVSVMQDGRIVEHGEAEQVLRRPDHPYTQRLLSAVPSLDVAAQEPAADRPPVLEVEKLNASYGSVRALHDVSVTLRAGECLALVGESGSGKSTLSRTIVGVGPRAEGDIRFDGENLSLGVAERSQDQRTRMQYVFQNPYGSFQPRRTVGDSIRVAAAHAGFRDSGGLAEHALTRVGLEIGHADRYPDELSGGERQRASLARALVCKPKLILCDEITSALDVSIQAQIIELLKQLMQEGVSLLFVTHDLAVAKALAHSVVVLRRGEIVESASAGELFSRAQHPYTRLLLEHNSSVESALSHRAFREVPEAARSTVNGA